MVTTLYLVRHCEAEGNIKRIFQGRTDADISENGRRQLEQLTERFAPVALDAIYSSPLRRAYLTAQAVDGIRGLPIHTDPRLQEIDGGDMEGRLWSCFPQDYPDESRLWVDEPQHFCAPNGESMAQVYDRMRQALTEIAAAHGGQTVAVTSHGCAIRNALCWALGKPLDEMNEVAWCDNTAVSLLVFEDGVPTVGMMNDNSHLDSESSTLEKQSWWRKDAVDRYT